MALVKIPDTLQAMVDMREASESLRALIKSSDDSYWERHDIASLLSMAADVHIFVDELLRLDTKYNEELQNQDCNCDNDDGEEPEKSHVVFDPCDLYPPIYFAYTFMES